VVINMHRTAHLSKWYTGFLAGDGPIPFIFQDVVIFE
jgi:hypothetical protein